MTANQPTAGEEAGALLRTLSSARQIYSLYPPEHPNRVDVIGDIVDAARRIRSASGIDPVLFFSRHAFYLGSSLLPRESLALYRLIEAFESYGVEAIEILPNASAEGADILVRMLIGEVSTSSTTPGFAVNRIRPSMTEDRDSGLSEVRRSYALGLELLRQTAVRVGAGKPVDQDAATRLVEQMAEQVMSNQAQALLLTSVKSHDEYTYYHMLNVCLLSLAVGYGVGLRHDQIVALGVGALLHDVGKLKVPPEVLNHAGSLSEEQWRIVQRHPVDGAGFVLEATAGRYDITAAIVLEHHAAYDLSGYPSLSGRGHPSLPARMVSVGDAYDAMTTNRPYRKAEERRQALNILHAGSGHGFDPSVVRAFVRLLGIFPVGSLVKLTDQRVGVVVRNHPVLLSRPVIRVVMDRTGAPCDPEELDLSTQAGDGSFPWAVQRSLDPDDVGLDMMSLLLAGETTEAVPAADGPQTGLVHEPSFGEPVPAGYLDLHNMA